MRRVDAGGPAEPTPSAGTPPEGALEWIESALGARVDSLAPLAPGAGRRRYWRVVLGTSRTAVLMHAQPEDPAILPPALRAPAGEIPFVVVTRLLARHDLPVPELHAVDRERGWVLLEDLGSLHLSDLDPAGLERRSAEAIDLLARAHAIDPARCALVRQRSFDVDWIRFELSLFLDEVEDSGLRGALADGFEGLASAIAGLERRLSLRDFQSQNLMVDPDGRLRVLDYQDALMAPPELDLAAFVFDSYVERGAGERARLLERYGLRSGEARDPAALALLIVERKCKDYSRFQHLVRVKGDRRFRGFEDAARRAVLETLPALPAGHAGLAELLTRAIDPELA